MRIAPPVIIQGGMGAAVSGWRLAQSVSKLGHLGVVSGTALDEILARRLQDGDPGGDVRRALDAFPLRGLAQRILDTFHVPGGKPPDEPYQSNRMHSVEGGYWPHALCVAANFVEVFLAREGHSNPVGINYLEKIQFPHLPSIYGAMLAGVAVVIVGAGIPMHIPGVLDAFAQHEAATYPISVVGDEDGDAVHTTFNPRDFWEGGEALPPLERPDFLPIVSSVTLATMLSRRTIGGIEGFIVEGSRAGGHNAPPRGRPPLSDVGEPVYGPRDDVDLAGIRKLGLPFWPAGSYGSPERLREARAAGAAGVQVGTAFALCTDSALAPDVRRALVAKALDGQAEVFTDAAASPTGYPFKVARLEGTLSEDDVYAKRPRLCDLGFLREAYRREDGSIGYRCAAEPEEAYVAKGGDAADTIGRKCLCNALVANIGMPQARKNGTHERCLITLGDDFANVVRFCSREQPEYSAADVVRILLG